MKNLLIILGLASISLGALAQVESDERALLYVKDGISIKKDSLFLLNLRFRMQSRFGIITNGGSDLNIAETDARVRRLRLRFDGFAVNTKLQYYIQLNFSRADQDIEGFGVPQIIRDAMVFYNFSPYFYIGFGQTKLPGNRQRVISSGNQQFPDRSLANGAFTLDRDFGFYAYYTHPLGKTLFNLKGALTTGDGRGTNIGNNGLAYTGRVEFLPFGAFKNNGDYSEGDLEFERKPKLSIGASYSFNDKAIRTGGQLGPVLYQPLTMSTFIADAILKYRGWGAQFEYFNRQSPQPVSVNALGDRRVILTGTGYLLQASKMVNKKMEVAGRYTSVLPTGPSAIRESTTEEAAINYTWYIKTHRIKLQTMLAYRWRARNANLSANPNQWTAMMQVEFGI